MCKEIVRARGSLKLLAIDSADNFKLEKQGSRWSLMEEKMRAHRFGRKLKLPATIAIKHQIRMLMFEDARKKAEAAGRAESIRGQPSEEARLVPDGLSWRG